MIATRLLREQTCIANRCDTRLKSKLNVTRDALPELFPSLSSVVRKFRKRSPGNSQSTLVPGAFPYFLEVRT